MEHGRGRGVAGVVDDDEAVGELRMLVETFYGCQRDVGFIPDSHDQIATHYGSSPSVGGNAHCGRGASIQSVHANTTRKSGEVGWNERPKRLMAI